MVIILDNEKDFTDILTILLRDVEKVDMSHVRIIKKASEFEQLLKEVDASTITAAFLDHDLAPQFDTKQIYYYTGRDALEELKSKGYIGKTYTISAYSERQADYVKKLFGDPTVTVISKSLVNPEEIINAIKNEIDIENNELKNPLK